tara:strand:+ start:585 stop:749 length:165 start_codon:yes stop_codon:yes gene_type:complete
MDYDTKKDFYAIAFVLCMAFFIGLIFGNESFTAMIALTLPTYIAIRYFQSKGYF